MSQDQIEEFGKCFEELEAPLIAYAYQILREREDARDQVQEAFKRMILREETIEQPKAWLYRTVRNLCISHLRKHQRIQKGKRNSSISSPENLMHLMIIIRRLKNLKGQKKSTGCSILFPCFQKMIEICSK